ncbi:MAG: hypothetical protein ACTTJC_00245 [Campylobacter sp.]
MSEFFKDAEKFQVDGASVPFYKFSQNGVKFVGLDTRVCPPPEPMINALVAIKFATEDTKIVMINHKFPAGLIPKLQAQFDIERQDLQGGAVKMTFSLKQNADIKSIDTTLCH